jgi:hypothetical protein
LRAGRFEPLELPARLLGFDRISEQRRVRCLFNLGETPQACPQVKAGEVMFATGSLDRARGILGKLAAFILELPVPGQPV